MSKLGLSEVIVLVVIFIIPQFFFLVTLYKTLKNVSVENRKMEPNMVWFSMIPFLGNIWQFFIVKKIASSLNAEFSKRNINIPEEQPGYVIGMTYCVLFCFSIIPLIGSLAFIAGFVCWIIYWIKINKYKNQLQNN
jgi:hypothetical protein